MKRLRRIRLINWHRFENETIDIGDSVLLSGENGAGKSTILDAVQFVVTCSKANFNKAAHDKGKRTLNTYIRCKTGREDRPFERSGELSAHIALEFYDEARQKPFILGVVMDSASVEKEPNVIWYQMENLTLTDTLFLSGNRVKSISVFRSTNKGIRTIAPTVREAQKLILSRFGRIDEKFFALIPKALAFKPIHDIKDFVYSYVLDEKEVNIDVLRENVRSYQDLLRMLEDVKTRIRQLEEITAKEQAVEGCIRRDRIQEYVIERASLDITREAIRKLLQDKNDASREEERLRKEEEALSEAILDKEEVLRNLDLELNSDIGYQAFRDLEKRESRLRGLLAKDKEEVGRLRGFVKKALSDAENLLRAMEAAALPAMGIEEIRGYRDSLGTLWTAPDLSALRARLEKTLLVKKELHTRAVERLADLRLSQKEKEDRRAETEAEVRQLRNKRLVYPENVSLLKSEVQREFSRIGRKGEVRILCELLEITDGSWQNAVEGYLNTQRFHLLVNPEDFDLALSIYERLRKEKRVYGAGLVNTAKLESYEEAPEGSLAQVVTSENAFARRYVHLLLGRVMRCDSVQELKKYSTSITRECMRYQNQVASAIHPKVYQTPFIGAEAYKVQLAMKEEELGALKKELSALSDSIRKVSALRPFLDSDMDVEVKYGLFSLENQEKHKAELEACRLEMQKLDASQNVLQKKLRLEAVKQEKQQMDERHMGIARRLGSLEQKRADLEERTRERTREQEAKAGAVRELFEGLGEDGQAAERNYLERRKDFQSGTPERIMANYESARKANQTTQKKAEEEMTRLMRQYKAEHDFGAPESLLGYPEFLAEYDKLKNSQLLEYEGKVYRAKEAAETEFREQFLSKLQENIREAQKEFKDLNDSLREIHFSKERYEFQHFPKKEHKKYYSMIMDDFNVMEGNSIFSGVFNETHREVIEELFEKLTLDDEVSAKTLEEYTDYRTYMDYDIKITADDGSYMLYSKVSREKSGGETQTPFYITIAASFMQLYKGAIGSDSVGLVMMDEAFNNMDDARIDGVLSFIQNSNLQLLVSCPPEKIQYIAPSLDQVLLVLQDGERSYVEDFTRAGQ